MWPQLKPIRVEVSLKARLLEWFFPYSCLQPQDPWTRRFIFLLSLKWNQIKKKKRGTLLLSQLPAVLVRLLCNQTDCGVCLQKPLCFCAGTHSAVPSSRCVCIIHSSPVSSRSALQFKISCFRKSSRTQKMQSSLWWLWEKSICTDETCIREAFFFFFWSEILKSFSYPQDGCFSLQTSQQTGGRDLFLL